MDGSVVDRGALCLEHPHEYPPFCKNGIFSKAYIACLILFLPFPNIGIAFLIACLNIYVTNLSTNPPWDDVVVVVAVAVVVAAVAAAAAAVAVAVAAAEVAAATVAVAAKVAAEATTATAEAASVAAAATIVTVEFGIVSHSY
ncbi:hypothetical protein PoB_000578500 [Plakobranchus ocellatus]|uniref:Uncharacterized protein n=1 Tax=Plakobranchus ocellatus TaxID=259542 RepID=A0AAV3Y824_9GAST|nr:hypothetical protein PoB_000578500 [Plakobranchus ocellatus]